MEVFIEDGAHVKPGDIAFVVEGKVQSLLQTERIVLNIMQRMSGIATTTHHYVELLEEPTQNCSIRVRLLRECVYLKTSSENRGGENHRIGLFDMILLKDNHVDFAGGIEKAIRGLRNI